MLLKLKRNARIMHKAGEVVEVSPEQAKFLLSLGSAEEVKKSVPKKAAKEHKDETDSKE